MILLSIRHGDYEYEVDDGEVDDDDHDDDDYDDNYDDDEYDDDDHDDDADCIDIDTAPVPTVTAYDRQLQYELGIFWSTIYAICDAY